MNIFYQNLLGEESELGVSNENLFSLFFNCSGSEDVKVIFNKDLKTFLHQNCSVPNETELFSYSFDDDLPINTLIRMARMNIQKLALAMNDDKITFFKTRESVTKLMIVLRCNYQDLR